jgi:hypothetical protein
LDAREFPVSHRHRSDGPGVIRRKRSWFSKDEISISISRVASVHIKTGIIWSDILIESSGGSDPLASHGHTKADARRIRELVETAQANPAGKVNSEYSSEGGVPRRPE